MKIISSLEKEPRNVYTGAIGYFGPDNTAVFNVAIRTIDFQRIQGKAYAAQMGIGGGIVEDSGADDEYQECELKAQFLVKSLPDFSLIETILCVDGKIKYRDMHLQRLKTSAQYFNIPCNVSDIKRTLKKYAAGLMGRLRLRLLLNAKGKIIIEQRLFTANFLMPPKIVISQYKTNSRDPFLYHKTTCRDLYDTEYREYSVQGFFDVLFCNEKNEITEGAISNIFIQKNGRLYTPPLKCGLLNGIGRRLMLKKSEVKEKILYPADLKKADKILLTNSVRGVNQVFLR
jgi:para-aminobenzoate synthetase/4-amino-4-deoxychorismate lyase